MSAARSSGESFTFFSFCWGVPTAHMSPASIIEFPPMVGIFSRMITLEPSLAAAAAAAKPAKPEPTMRMSVDSSHVVGI